MLAKRARAHQPYRPKLPRRLDRIREVFRYHHYLCKTEQTYASWILRFIRFNATRHPATKSKPEIERFLSHLAINRAISASTRGQAMHAILFLYRHVIHRPLVDELAPVGNRKSKCLPAVLCG